MKNSQGGNWSANIPVICWGALNLNKNCLLKVVQEKEILSGISFRFNVSLKCRVNIELFIYECLESTFGKIWFSLSLSVCFLLTHSFARYFCKR